MSKIFKCEFIQRDSKLEIQFLDQGLFQNQLRPISDESKLEFINNYLEQLEGGNTPVVINPAIPAEVKNQLFCSIEQSLKIKNLGHVLCTSGTSSPTQTPKSFFFHFESFVENAHAHNVSLDLKEGVNILFPLPLYHSFGVVVGVWSSLLLRGKTYLTQDQFSVQEIFNLLSEVEFDVVYLTPSLVENIIKFRKRFKRKLITPKKISIGSSLLTYESANKLRDIFPQSEFYYTYGLTEMGPRVSTQLIDFREMHGPIPIGEPLDNVKFNYGKNLEVISQYAAEGLREKFFDTKDSYELTDFGVKIKGRSDDTIIYQGRNIFPAEIEQVVRDVDHNCEVALVGVASKLFGQVPVLVYVGKMEENEIVKKLAELTPESHLPKKIIKWETLPKNHMGKIERAKIISILEQDA